jgi:hypothetical protein
MTNFLTIDLKNNDLLHQDLVLEIPSIDFVLNADTYYFVLDNSIDDYPALNRKKTILSIILNQWKIKLEQMKLQNVCFLPFDFSDEYIGCFRFEIIEDDLVMGVYGITQTLLGMMINPSKLEQFNIVDSDFEEDSSHFNVSRSDLISSIEDSLNKLK